MICSTIITILAQQPKSATKVHKKNDIHNSVCHFFVFFAYLSIVLLELLRLLRVGSIPRDCPLFGTWYAAAVQTSK